MPANTMTCETFWARIYLSGPIEAAKQILRREAMNKPICATIEPTAYIYTGGEEAGYVVGLVNYPRFPDTPENLTKRAEELALTLLEETYQWSAMVQSPSGTWWVSVRGDK